MFKPKVTYDSVLNAAAEVKGIETSSDVLEALNRNSAGKNSGRSRTIASDVVGLVGNVLHKASAKILILILELDCLGDSNTVL